jgi:hypothetical protein
VVKVVCFDTHLEVFILKGLRSLKIRIKSVLILKNLAAGILQEIGFSRSAFNRLKENKYRAEAQGTPRQDPREARGKRGKRRDRGEEWDGVNRASWQLTIKD